MLPILFFGSFKGLSVGTSFAPSGATVSSVSTHDHPFATYRAEHARFVGLYLPDHLSRHLFQFVQELLCRVFASLYLPQFLFPSPCQFGRFEQRGDDGVDEFDPDIGGAQGLALLHDIVSLVEFLDDSRTCGWSSYAVLFHGVAEFFIVNGLSCCLHGTEQGRLGVVFGWCCGLFLQPGSVRSALTFDESREGLACYLFVVWRIVFFIGFIACKDLSPSGFEHLSASYLEGIGFFFLHLGAIRRRNASISGYFCYDRSIADLTIGVKSSNEAERHKVKDLAFLFGQVVRTLTCGDDGMVVGNLLIIKYFLGFTKG